MLAAALALEEGRPSSPGAGDALRAHYLDLMPSLCVEQSASTAPPYPALFETPLDWARLPRLRGAIDRLFALTAEVVPPGQRMLRLGAPDPDAFRRARPTLGGLCRATHYGGVMPLLYGYPADLAAAARLLDAGAPVEEVIDSRLAAPLAHELAHLAPGRAALQPPYLDECLAAWLGARILPSTIWPEDRAHALPGAPWLAQTGFAFARALGDQPLLAAHAGALEWAAVLPQGLAAAFARLGWQEHERTRAPHFLSSTERPWPWIKLLHLAVAGAPLDPVIVGGPDGLDRLEALPWLEVPVGEPADADLGLVEAALRAACLCVDSRDGSLEVEARLPSGPITIDLAACVVRPAAGDRAPSHFFPPALAARLRRAGPPTIELRLDSLDAIPAAARSLVGA